MGSKTGNAAKADDDNDDDDEDDDEETGSVGVEESSNQPR
jgi:hypothetical protein